MAIPARQRWIGYVILLALTLAAVKWAGGQNHAEPAAAVAQAAERTQTPARGAPARGTQDAALPAVQLEKLARRAPPAPAADPFQARSWEQMLEQESRRDSPPPPPPRPEAPPLPFAYIGKLIEDGKTTVFLTKQDENYIVRLGDKLDDSYRVEAIEANRLVLKYLPLGTRQILELAGSGPSESPAAPAAPRDQEDDD